MAENKTALEVMESSKANLERKLDRLKKRLSGGTMRSKLNKKLDDLDEQIAKLMNKKGEIQDEIANLVEDTIDGDVVRKEIADLEATIGEYDKAIATLKQ